MNDLSQHLDEFFLLTKKHLSFVANGCGPKFGKAAIVVPDFGGLYYDACVLHDWIYWSGGSERIRLLADRKFRADIIAANRKLSWWKSAMMCWVPSVYYYAVRKFGKGSFHYSELRRTRVELNKEMRNARA